MRCGIINYNEKRWKLLRKSILKRDGYMCCICKRYGKRVDAQMVHHIYPVSEYPEYRWKSQNLISVCNACHEKLHDRSNGELTELGKRLKQQISPQSLL